MTKISQKSCKKIALSVFEFCDDDVIGSGQRASGAGPPSMFDMKTAQMLTAAIFGLSTLISSYLVYNVEKRIQVPERPFPPAFICASFVGF